MRPADGRPRRTGAAGALALGLTGLLTGLVVSLGGCRKEEAGPLLPGEYRSWDRTTDQVLDYPIPGHEDRGRRILINSTGTGAAASSESHRVSWEYPAGTIIIKEIFAGQEVREAEQPLMLTGMVKDPDHPQARGGWVWVVRDMTTGGEQIIDWEFCVDCHANANEPHPYGDRNEDNEFRDYVFFPYRPR